MDPTLACFFNPSGVALIGASATANKLSYGILRNLSGGYQGGVYPVNPRYDEILGHRAYADIGAVPDPLELAVIALSAPAVPDALEACGKRGVRAVTIISGGFKEVGEQGADLEQQCLQIAKRYGMRLVGPNCVGTLDLYSRMNTTFIQGVPETGGIGFISQSGAVGGGVVDYIRNKGVGFSCFASLGNEVDVTETDMIEYLGQDARTRVIACYVEQIRDGRRFMEVAGQVTKVKPVVLLKAGRTLAGARAVSSHTGSLAGSHAAYEAAFWQSGVIEANSVAELFDIAAALDTQPLPRGKRVALVTNAGGPAALASDSLAAHGLALADLSAESIATLEGGLCPSAQTENPVDMLGGAEPHEYELACRQTLADPGVDALLAIHVPQALVDPAEVAKAIARAAQDAQKPVLACFMGEASVGEARRVLYESGIPMYVFPESVGRVFGAMLEYKNWLEKPRGKAQTAFEAVRETAERILTETAGAGSLGEAAARPLLQAYGIPLVKAQVAHTAAEARQAAEQIGFPVVLKIVSPDILHKSDAGGIRLNLGSGDAVETAYEDMLAQVLSAQPQAQIEGVLVEAMLRGGVEVIVGMRRDPYFGPLMLFGLGGIYVELFRDVAFGVAPLTRAQARALLERTRAFRLLTGFRGQPPADLDAVVDCILRLGQLALDFPQIEEAEVNPLLVMEEGKGAVALDARVILKE
jgi:acetyltransferase